MDTYEKKYKEALERARIWKDKGGMPKYKQGILDDIFPELKENKESDDEKVRKELIKEINGLWENDSATWPSSLEKKNKYIAWLEKQGEKPRYNIGDVLCDKSCTTLNKDAQPNFEIIDIRDGMYICDKGSFPISQQDEYELVAKKIEQKPTNEEMKELLHTEYEKGRADAIAEMQKGWSEEDECILFRTINDLKFLKDTISIDPNYAVNIIDIEREIDWLKSLKDRYTWRPSDEQMKALKHAFNDCSIAFADMKILATLYEQLKALHRYEQDT